MPNRRPHSSRLCRTKILWCAPWSWLSWETPGPPRTRLVPSNKLLTSAIPLAVLGERETQRPGAPLIGAWFEAAGDKVDTISVSSNLEKWSSEGRGVPSLLSLPESESTAQNVDRAPHVSAVAVSANRGWIAVGFENGTLMITRSNGSERRTIPAASDATKITAVAFSPDANLILAGYANYSIRVWNANGTIQRELGDEATRHTGSISSVQFSADGKWVLSSSWDGTAKIWDPKTGKLLAVLQREDAFAYTATFSPDGHLVICGYSDGPAWIWNSSGKGAPIKLEGHTGAVTSTSFSPDGLKVVTGSEDSSARIWALRVDDRGKSFVADDLEWPHASREDRGLQHRRQEDRHGLGRRNRPGLVERFTRASHSGYACG